MKLTPEIMKTRLDVLKQHAETTKVLKFQGWMRELIAMLKAAEAYRPVSAALMRDNIALKATITALEAKLEKVGEFADGMAKPECEANEVDDCHICQGYITHANELKAIIK